MHIAEYMCYCHPDIVSVAGCSRCQQFICSDCKVTIGGVVYCKSCADIVHKIDNKQEYYEVNTATTKPKMIQSVREGKVNLKLLLTESPVILQNDEEPRFMLPNISLLEPRSVRTSGAFYGGPTFRVAKGVSFRLGAASGRSTSHEEIKNIDTGILTLTNFRLVFSGSMKTANIPLAKIVTVEPYNDWLQEGIGIMKSSATKMQYFCYPKNKLNLIQVQYTYEGMACRDNFSGQWLKAIVDGVLVQSKEIVAPKAKEIAVNTKTGDAIIQQIKKLDELRDDGTITDAEFEAKKAELLKRL